MTNITVHKLDAQGHHILAYAGRLVERGETWICIRAVFERDNVAIDDITLCQGDVMIEWFYKDRYYNVFKIQDGQNDSLKGWYCNITRPAYITETEIFAEDLALDIVIYADGRIIILDEDEFDALHLDSDDITAARAAVDEIKELAKSRISPFVP